MCGSQSTLSGWQEFSKGKISIFGRLQVDAAVVWLRVSRWWPVNFDADWRVRFQRQNKIDATKQTNGVGGERFDSVSAPNPIRERRRAIESFHCPFSFPTDCTRFVLFLFVPFYLERLEQQSPEILRSLHCTTGMATRWIRFVLFFFGGQP